MTRRTAIAASVALIGTRNVGGSSAQAPVASPEATPVGSPSASPVASPVATPIATPVPDFPLDIFHADNLPDDGEPIEGGVLRLPVRGANLLAFEPTPQRQDPKVAWSYLDGLVRIDHETGSPVPSLARSWTWSGDGLQLTFTLRDDVTWHDGAAFTADDARFTHIAYRDDYRSVIAGQSGLVLDVVAINDTTLQVQFDQPDGAWLYNVASLPVMQRAQYLAWWEANPVGERTLEGISFDDTPPVGTGPWRIESATEDGISFTRNRDYFDTPPHAERLELIAVDDPDERVNMWRSGDLDAVGQLDPQRVDDLLNDEGRVVVADAPRTLFAAFNFDNASRLDPAMLADPALRLALSLALDRTRYAEEIWNGFLRYEEAGVVAQRWADAGDAQNPDQAFDRSRELLAESGWRDVTGDGNLDSPAGDALMLTALVLDNEEPAVIATLKAMHSDLQKIGGALSIEVLPRDQFVTRWSQDRSWDLIVYDLRLYPAFAEFDLIGSAWDIRINPAGWNPGGYSNPAADAAIDAYFQAVDEEDMAAALQDLQNAIVVDPFALWLGFPQDLVLLATDVRGFVPNPLWPTLDTRLMWLDDGDS